MNSIIFSFFGDWYHLIDKPILVGDVKRVVEKGSVPAFGFYFMLAASGVIATFGLLSNSAAVIIGAMIVAPLMLVQIKFCYISTGATLITQMCLPRNIGFASQSCRLYQHRGTRSN